MLEIERKFIINSPEIDKIISTASSSLFVAQWYVFTEREFRIRVIVCERGEVIWIRTVKTGEGLIREEEESKIQAVEVPFERLRESRCVVKSRYVFPGVDYEGVIDRYFYPDMGYIAEIEMKNGVSHELMPTPDEVWELDKTSFEDVTGNRGLTARAVSRVMETDELIELMKIMDAKERFPASQRLKFKEILMSIYSL